MLNQMFYKNYFCHYLTLQMYCHLLINIADMAKKSGDGGFPSPEKISLS
jgi:hypothetical protein